MEDLTADLESMRVAVERVGQNGTGSGQSGQQKSEGSGGSGGNHTFTAKIGNTTIFYSVIKKESYSFLWVGTSGGTLINLSVSMPTPYDKGAPPPATQILGSADHTQSSALASKLARRNNRAYYVSYNLPNSDARLSLGVDQKLFEEIAVHPEKF